MRYYFCPDNYAPSDLLSDYVQLVVHSIQSDVEKWVHGVKTMRSVDMTMSPSVQRYPRGRGGSSPINSLASEMMALLVYAILTRDRKVCIHVDDVWMLLQSVVERCRSLRASSHLLLPLLPRWPREVKGLMGSCVSGASQPPMGRRSSSTSPTLTFQTLRTAPPTISKSETDTARSHHH